MDTKFAINSVSLTKEEEEKEKMLKPNSNSKQSHANM